MQFCVGRLVQGDGLKREPKAPKLFVVCIDFSGYLALRFNSLVCLAVSSQLHVNANRSGATNRVELQPNVQLVNRS